MDTSQNDQVRVQNWTGVPGCIPEGEVAVMGPGGVQFFKEDPEAFVKYSYHLSGNGELVQVVRPLLGGTWNNFNGDFDATRRYLIALELKEQKEKETAEYLEKLRAEEAAAKLANTRIKEAREALSLEAFRLREKKKKKRLAAEMRRSSTECPSSSFSSMISPPTDFVLKKKKK